MRFLFGNLFGVETLVGFDEKQCRKTFRGATLAMNSDVFSIRCSDCGRSVAIRAVSVFHSAGRHCGYSYSYSCECGCRIAVDGCDGDDIPDSMKTEASLRHNAYRVLKRINLQRRNLPPSDAKACLRNARLDMPESISENEWLVYRCGDDWSVTFCSETEVYSLRVTNTVHAFPDIESLAKNLRPG